MKILAIDSSGLTASAALVTEDAILAEYNTDFKKTHSQTLLPMIHEIFEMTATQTKDLDAVAIAKGPGSFTGLRIGSATAKGLTLPFDIPIIEISTLEGMAYEMYGTEGVICPMMDARRNQVYYGLYQFNGEELECIHPDRADSIEECAEAVNAVGKSVVFLGDGVPVHMETLKAEVRCKMTFAKPFQNRQRAAALGTLAIDYFKSGKTVSSDEHAPVYLRVSQAERERAERERNAEK